MSPVLLDRVRMMYLDHLSVRLILPIFTDLLFILFAYIYAALYKAGSKNSAAEEIKEGVMNNFAYVRCTGASNSLFLI